jgi:Putative prokaryotic signal transducing protein
MRLASYWMWIVRIGKEFMSDVVTIAHFTEPLEAEMARLRLQSAGIETFLSGENARILEPGLGPLELQVSAEDEADARAVLADPGLRESDLPGEAS